MYLETILLMNVNVAIGFNSFRMATRALKTKNVRDDQKLLTIIKEAIDCDPVLTTCNNVLLPSFHYRIPFERHWKGE